MERSFESPGKVKKFRYISNSQVVEMDWGSSRPEFTPDGSCGLKARKRPVLSRGRAAISVGVAEGQGRGGEGNRDGMRRMWVEEQRRCRNETRDTNLTTRGTPIETAAETRGRHMPPSWGSIFEDPASPFPRALHVASEIFPDRLPAIRLAGADVHDFSTTLISV